MRDILRLIHSSEYPVINKLKKRNRKRLLKIPTKIGYFLRKLILEYVISIHDFNINVDLDILLWYIKFTNVLFHTTNELIAIYLLESSKCLDIRPSLLCKHLGSRSQIPLGRVRECNDRSEIRSIERAQQSGRTPSEAGVVSDNMLENFKTVKWTLEQLANQLTFNNVLKDYIWDRYLAIFNKLGVIPNIDIFRFIDHNYARWIRGHSQPDPYYPIKDAYHNNHKCVINYLINEWSCTSLFANTIFEIVAMNEDLESMKTLKSKYNINKNYISSYCITVMVHRSNEEIKNWAIAAFELNQLDVVNCYVDNSVMEEVD